MKRMLFLAVCIFAFSIGCMADNTGEFIFSFKPYLKDGFHDDYYTDYRYVFTKGLLTSVQIVKERESDIEHQNITIKRNPGLIQVSLNDQPLMTCTRVDENNFIIKITDAKYEFLVTIENNIVYCGIENNQYERFFRIVKDDKISFKFFRDGVPMNRRPFFDFKVDDSNSSKIEFVNFDGHYEQIEDAIFDDISNDPLDRIPGGRYIILNKMRGYQFTIVDIFIDYFCVTRMNHPIILCQLLAYSNNRDLFSSLGL
jgi:hypothetical protein